MAAYARWLPLINDQNRQCGLQAAKILMKEGGVIGSDAVRHPLQRVHPAARAGLVIGPPARSRGVALGPVISLFVMAVSSRPSTSFLASCKTWMPGTRPSMTNSC